MPADSQGGASVLYLPEHSELLLPLQASSLDSGPSHVKLALNLSSIPWAPCVEHASPREQHTGRRPRRVDLFSRCIQAMA